MADFNYTPEIGQSKGYSAQLGVKSNVASLANDVGTLLKTKQVADAKVAKQEAKYLEDINKERYNEASLALMDEQDRLYERYNTTADPEARNMFVEEFDDNVSKIGTEHGLEGDDEVKFKKGASSTTNKLRLYNSNVLGKANDNVNIATANTADFGSMDVVDTKNMDNTSLKNNREYLIRTEFSGKKAKYFDAKFNDFGIRLKESVAESTSPEEIDTLLENLDIFAKEKLGDTVSVNNKDATVDSTMYNGYHKNRQFLLEKKASAITKLRSSLVAHTKGNDKEAYMETVERIDKVGGYENPDLKSSAISAWDQRTQKANTSKINALKKTPEYINGYSDPSIVDSTYKAHGGTDEQFMIDYKQKHDFTTAYVQSLGNTDLTANPKQAKLVADDLIKNLVLSGDIATAVEISGKTGQGGVLKSYATATLGTEDPKTLTENVQKLSEGYNSNKSVMSNNMEKDDKSAMFFYNYTLRNGTITEAHIARVKEGNAEGIVQKAGKEFNEEFAGKSNYTENIGIYSALVKYGVPPQTAVDYIKEDTEAHVVTVDGGWTGIWGGMDVDLRGAPNGVNTYDTQDLETVLEPLIKKVNDIGVEGEKKLVYDKTTGDFRLFVDEVPMQDMAVNLDDLISFNAKKELADENTPWANTSRKIADGFNSLTSFFGTQLRETIETIDEFDRQNRLDQAKNATIKISTNKALKGTSTPVTAETAVQQPEYVEEVMKVALDTRENASALFNKDGINEYIGFLNTGFVTLLTEPLTVGENGKVTVEGEPMDVTSPNGRKEVEDIIKAKQAIENKQVLKYDATMTEDEVRALQTKLGVKADGVFGNTSKDALQRYNAVDLTKDSIETNQAKYSDKNLNWKDIGKGRINPITGLSGTIAHRNNNPGAMKLEFAGAILGRTVSSSKMRSRATAIKRAKELYDGVVTLDRAGFIVFDGVESGRSAQIELLTRAHKTKTIEEMLPEYAIADGSGATHHKEYAKAIYKFASSKGIDLKGKKIGDMSKQEVQTLTRAMAKVEGGA